MSQYTLAPVWSLCVRLLGAFATYSVQVTGTDPWKSAQSVQLVEGRTPAVCGVAFEVWGFLSWKTVLC